ncbi:MAG: pitrilysin family protein [Bacillota bacterium]|jgi:predicted Zn-dependent peptidase|nr:pitrilysin family protein [Bacillota bacterium]
MYNKTVLSNGVRIVSEEMPGVRSVAFGIWIGTGSHYEDDTEAGISHLIEHLLFKGTEKRTAKEIAEAIESVGGHLNAFTSKEYTCYYARVLDEHLPIAIDVLADMFFSSLFTPEDIEREKKVVQEEIRMYEDSPDEIIHDLFTQTIWDGHPLGRPVIGTRDSVAALSREKITSFYQKHYRPANLVLALAGNIKHEKALSLLEPLFAEATSKKAPEYHTTPPQPRAIFKHFYKPLEQVQLCLGVPGLSQKDEQIYALQILNNILGGGASSRLFQKIREERALVYSIYSYYTAYRDTGLFAIYAATNPDNFHDVLQLSWQEVRKIAKEGISPEELNRSKEQIKGSILLASENVTHRMHRLGKSELIYNRLIPTEEVLEKVALASCEELQRLALELLDSSRFTGTVLGNLDTDRVFLPWAMGF